VLVAIALGWPLPVLLHARGAQPADAGGKAGQAAEACEQSSHSALWRLAQSCAQNLKNDPDCRAYARDNDAEYVILKDHNTRRKPANYLIIPVSCVTGIEDSRVFSSSVVDLWEDAWLWSRKYPGVPAARTGLAINSKWGRTQNQLHIHISCVRPDVASYLRTKDIPMYPAKAVALHLSPDDCLYKAVKVTGFTGENSPFKVLLATLGHKDGHAVKDGDLQNQTVAVVGSEKPDEFYVLATSAEDAHCSHAEELLEQTCQ
jgi:CDP-diacylglycerol pyrophosphatase